MAEYHEQIADEILSCIANYSEECAKDNKEQESDVMKNICKQILESRYTNFQQISTKLDSILTKLQERPVISVAATTARTTNARATTGTGTGSGSGSGSSSRADNLGNYLSSNAKRVAFLEKIVDYPLSIDVSCQGGFMSPEWKSKSTGENCNKLHMMMIEHSGLSGVVSLHEFCSNLFQHAEQITDKNGSKMNAMIIGRSIIAPILKSILTADQQSAIMQLIGADTGTAGAVASSSASGVPMVHVSVPSSAGATSSGSAKKISWINLISKPDKQQKFYNFLAEHEELFANCNLEHLSKVNPKESPNGKLLRECLLQYANENGWTEGVDMKTYVEVALAKSKELDIKPIVYSNIIGSMIKQMSETNNEQHELLKKFLTQYTTN